jgi:CelD/BcsL family acetyltransferase involved in cellulose biosynthesis
LLDVILCKIIGWDFAALGEKYANSRSLNLPALRVGGLHIRITSHLADVEGEWRALETKGITSYYQSFGWCSAWLATHGAELEVRPVIICGYQPDGNLAFILPLQLRKKFSLNVLEWLTQPDNNYGYGIFNPAFMNPDWYSENLTAILALLPRYDVLNLQNMPAELMNRRNPLQILNRFEAANSSYVMALKPNYETLLQSKRTAKSISKIRRRDERLAELGAISFEVEAQGEAAQQRLLETFHDKDVQLSELGIHGVFGPAERAFMQQLEKHSFAGPSGLHVFRLALDGKTLSTLVGAKSGTCFWLMVTSLASDIPRQFSPGDVLLRRTIQHCCEDGIQNFDFSNGEVGYKLMWADAEVLLHNNFQAASLRGLPLAALFMAFNSLKRVVKKSGALRQLFNESRRILRGKKPQI